MFLYKTRGSLNYFVALLSDTPMFYIKYLTMYKVHMHAGAIRMCLYGCAYVREIISLNMDFLRFE